MTTIILCSHPDPETPEFLETERALLDELVITSVPGDDPQVHTLRLKERPIPVDAEETDCLSRELMEAFGLEQQKFQSESLSRNGLPFLVIRVLDEMTTEAGAVTAPKKTGVKWSLPRIRWQTPALIVGGVLILATLYYGIGMLLVQQIDASYAERDCESVLGVAGKVKSLYPTRVASFVLPALAQMEECDVYVTAARHQEAGTWDRALGGYQTYLEEYPTGIYTTESRENAAETLVAWAEEQARDKNYDEAITLLQTVLSMYPKTSSVATARADLAEDYVTWSREVRESGMYPAAEEILINFQKWADQNGSDQDEKNADLELAWLYVYWARDLITARDYENAVPTYEMVMDLEPAPKAADGPSSLATQELPPARVGWADDLVTKKKFEQAVEQYELAISSMRGSGEQSAIKDKLARSCIKWAASLASSGDYWAAFERISMAEDKSDNATVKQDAAAARAQTLDAFANSQETQAVQYMDQAASALVIEEKTPELPIFGIDEDSVHIYTYLAIGAPAAGAFAGLSESIYPKTPAEMHYVAYVTQEERVIQTCTYYYVGSGGFAGTIERHRYSWKAKLIDVQTGKTFRTKEFTGSSPDGCPYSTYSTTDIWGGIPTSADLEAWLNTFVK